MGVADGDTITRLDGNRQQHGIRLGGIDASELGQPYGRRSKQRLAELAFGKDAKAACYKVDRYGESNPHRVRHLVRMTRRVPGYALKPILFNEDDHFDFARADCNFLAAIGEYASWSHFDPCADGFQSPPVTWSLQTDRKPAFFDRVREITGS